MCCVNFPNTQTKHSARTQLLVYVNALPTFYVLRKRICVYYNVWVCLNVVYNS